MKLRLLRVNKRHVQQIEQNKQSTTSTTVTRRDADGNVVDVQKSQTTVENAPQNKTNEPEVTDPFN